MKLNKSSLIILILFFGCRAPEKEWTALFNGENLEGWHSYGTKNSYDGWTAKDGILSFDYTLKKGVKSSSLVTNKEYTNFELSLDWKISKEGNSGIFWGVIEDDKYEHPYHTGPEIQILDDNWTAYVEGRGAINRAGSLYGLLPPLKIVSKPAEEWNHYLLHINHLKNVGYLEFNNTEILRFPVHGVEWEEMISKSSFSKLSNFGKAKTGHISLQDHGGKVSFKNIKIRTLE